MMHARLLALTLSAVVALPTAHALAELPPAPTVTLTETFDAPFPAWESGWFGQNSNARNYYCYGETSCTESYGTYLWISDPTGPSGAPVTVVFNTAFGASLLSLQMDLRAYSASNLIVYDSAGAVLYDQPSQQSQYVTHAITSTNGISRFELTGDCRRQHAVGQPGGCVQRARAERVGTAAARRGRPAVAQAPSGRARLTCASVQAGTSRPTSRRSSRSDAGVCGLTMGWHWLPPAGRSAGASRGQRCPPARPAAGPRWPTGRPRGRARRAGRWPRHRSGPAGAGARHRCPAHRPTAAAVAAAAAAGAAAPRPRPGPAPPAWPAPTPPRWRDGPRHARRPRTGWPQRSASAHQASMSARRRSKACLRGAGQQRHGPAGRQRRVLRGTA
jgi:hypothetical protein